MCLKPIEFKMLSENFGESSASEFGSFWLGVYFQENDNSMLAAPFSCTHAQVERARIYSGQR
jgi:hypothetical protein